MFEFEVIESQSVKETRSPIIMSNKFKSNKLTETNSQTNLCEMSSFHFRTDEIRTKCQLRNVSAEKRISAGDNLLIAANWQLILRPSFRFLSFSF